MASIFILPYVKRGFAIVAKTSWTVLRQYIVQQGYSSLEAAFSRLNTEEEKIQIAYLELSALFLTIFEIWLLAKQAKRYRELLQARVIVLKVDNSNVVDWCKAGRCPYHPWNRLFEFLFLLEIALDVQFVVVWVPSELQKADPLTRGASSLKVEFSNKRSKARTFKARKHSKKCLRAFAKVLTGDMEDLWEAVEERSRIQVHPPLSLLRTSPGGSCPTTRGLASC